MNEICLKDALLFAQDLYGVEMDPFTIMRYLITGNSYGWSWNDGSPIYIWAEQERDDPKIEILQ